MKRAGILGLAILLTLGLAVSASQAAKAKKVASAVEVEGWYFPEDEFVFTLVGDVHSKKNKCEKGRIVTILESDQPTDNGTVVETLTTDETGDWELAGDEVSEPYVVAEVDRRKVTKRNGGKLICKADRSGSFQILF